MDILDSLDIEDSRLAIVGQRVSEALALRGYAWAEVLYEEEGVAKCKRDGMAVLGLAGGMVVE